MTRRQAVKIVFLKDSREGQGAHPTVEALRGLAGKSYRAAPGGGILEHGALLCLGLLGGGGSCKQNVGAQGSNPGAHTVEGQGHDANLVAAFADEGNVVNRNAVVAEGLG